MKLPRLPKNHGIQAGCCRERLAFLNIPNNTQGQHLPPLPAAQNFQEWPKIPPVNFWDAPFGFQAGTGKTAEEEGAQPGPAAGFGVRPIPSQGRISWGAPGTAMSLAPNGDCSQDGEPCAPQICEVICGQPEPPFPQGFLLGFPQGFPQAELLAALLDFPALLLQSPQREIQPPLPGPIHHSSGKSMARHLPTPKRTQTLGMASRNPLAPSKGKGKDWGESFILLLSWSSDFYGQPHSQNFQGKGRSQWKDNKRTIKLWDEVLWTK